MSKTDPVRDFLKKKGCPPHIIEGGLLGLVQNWEDIVESVKRSYPLGLEDYLNDLDGRQLLEEALNIASTREKEKYLEQVRRSDKLMRSLVKPAGKCLWGDEVAQTEGWTAEKNWWYFTQPIHATSEFLSEIKKA
jgi:hypothetical protein